MSDPVTMGDLRVIHELLDSRGENVRELIGRDVTLRDLIQVLEGMGAERRSLWSWNEKGGRKVMEPGSYLVLPLPTPQEEK